jgi:hypothetical protein
MSTFKRLAGDKAYYLTMGDRGVHWYIAEKLTSVTSNSNQGGTTPYREPATENVQWHILEERWIPWSTIKMVYTYTSSKDFQNTRVIKFFLSNDAIPQTFPLPLKEAGEMFEIARQNIR